MYAGTVTANLSSGGAHRLAAWANGGKDLFCVLQDGTTVVRADGDVTPLTFTTINASTVNDSIRDLQYSPADRILYLVRGLDIAAVDVDATSASYGSTIATSNPVPFTGSVQSGTLDGSGRRLAALDQSATPTLWVFDTDRSSPTWLNVIGSAVIPSAGGVNRARWCAGGHQVLVGTWFGAAAIQIYDVAAGAFVASVDNSVVPGIGTTYDWDLSRDGRVLIVRGGTGLTRVTPIDPRTYILSTGAPLPTTGVLTTHNVFIDPQGNQILLLDEALGIFGGNPSLRFIDIATGADLAPQITFGVPNISQFTTR